jgi:hypothetical protein
MKTRQAFCWEALVIAGAALAAEWRRGVRA